MQNRYVVALASFIAMLLPGALYGFSVFAAPLAATLHASVGELNIAFSLSCVFLSIGAIAGGALADRYGPRYVAFAGALLWGGGNLGVALMLQSAGMIGFDLSYGVLGGLGVGLVYIACTSAAVRWFGKARGFGSGLTLAGFGLGALAYGAFLRILPASKDLVSKAYAGTAAVTPADISFLHDMFLYSGIVFMIVGVICALMIAYPDAVHSEENPPENAAVVIRTPQFIIMWAILFFNVLLGIVVIQRGVSYIEDLTKEPLAFVAGVFFLISFANGLGRVFFGALSDRIGHRKTSAAITAIQLLAIFAVNSLHDIVSVSLAFALILFSYGGGFGIMPSWHAAEFGLKRFGVSYGVLLTAWSVGAVIGPAYVALFKSISGTYAGAFDPIGLCLLISLIFPVIYDSVNEAGYMKRLKRNVSQA